MATTSTAPADVMRATIAALNAHDTAAMRRCWHDDVLEHFPDRTCHGADELQAYFDALFAAFPDASMEIQASAEEGESVFVRWVLTGTHTGAPFQGIDPTGKAIRLDGIDHMVVRDGRLASNHVAFDQMTVARALGLLPPDGSAADRAVKRGFNALLAVRRRARRGG